MILVDTSVWIEFFKQRNRYVQEMEPLLSAKLVITIEPIFSELLYGIRQKEDKEMIMSFWNILPRIDFGANSMLEASRFASENHFYRLGIGLMDAIIIKSAIDGKHAIWTLDRRINNNIEKNYMYP